jgi:formylmethanofuran dehydrogenase subunit C
MSGGTIIIGGNAESNLGNGMSGGTLICRGAAKSPIGMNMEGGKIIVHGDVIPAAWPFLERSLVSQSVGEDMEGGEIHLEAGFKYTSDMKGKRIYHRGKLISE